MKHAGSYRAFAVVCGLGMVCALAQADTTYIFDVAGEANATVTTGLDTITITLTDLYINPGNVADNLSAFWFTTSTTPTSGSIASSSADAIDVASNGHYTDAGTVSPGWILSQTSAVTKLDDLTGGGPGPAHTIIGAPGSANYYSSANNSIKGNGPHNDFLDQTATWTLTEDGVTAATVISNAYFQFGTTDGHGVKQGTEVSVTQVGAVPEPATMALLFAGLPLIFLSRKYRRR